MSGLDASELLQLAYLPGHQCAFALLLAAQGWPPTAEGLSSLALQLEASPRWPCAVALWRESAPWRWPRLCREEFSSALRLRSVRSKSAVRFRGSAVRDGRHDFEAGEVMGKLGGAAKRRTGWQAHSVIGMASRCEVSLSQYDTEAWRHSWLGPLLNPIEVFAVVCGDVAVVGLPLFPEWRGTASGLSVRPERYFVLPREVRPRPRPQL